MFGTRRSRAITQTRYATGYAPTATTTRRRGLGGLLPSRRRRGVSGYQTEPVGMYSTTGHGYGTGTRMTTGTTGHGRGGRAPLSMRVKQFLGLGRARFGRTATGVGRY